MCRISRVLVFAGLLAALGATGCAEKKKDAGDDQLAAQAAQLKQCQDELTRLQADMQQKLADLERENGELKNKLMAGGAAKEPAAPPGWKTVPGGAMIALDGQVLFDFAKSSLKPEGRKTLDTIAATLKSKYPGYDIYVVGHTDNRPVVSGKWKDNYELSCERSLSVVRYLMSKGIKPQSLAACGWGEHRPVAPNATPAERAFNRRVEIFAMAPHGTKAPHAQSAKPETP